MSTVQSFSKLGLVVNDLIRTHQMVLLLTITVICLLPVLLYIQFRWRHRHILATASGLPCPPTWPFIGNALLFVGGNTRITKNIMKLTTKYKHIFCIWAGPTPIFVVNNPSDIQVVLNSSNTLEKDSSYNALKIFLGNGLITAPAPIWKKYRRLINPVMHHSNLEHFMPVFNKVANEMVQELVAGNTIIDPTDVFFNAAITAITSTIITKEYVDIQTRTNVQNLFRSAGLLLTESMFKPWLHSEWCLYLLRSQTKYALQLYSDVMYVFDKLWQDEIQRKKSNLNVKHETEGITHKTLIDAYLDNPHIGDDHDWRDERSTMISAGSDTVVGALSFVLITLANHPDVQEKVLSEIREVVGNLHEVTLSDLNNLTYLGQVIMESMRLHGSVPLIMRKASKDTKLSMCTLPAGSRVMIPLYALGHDQELFPEPQKFLPERFSPDALRSRHIYSFIPFSAGPRNCIGKMYAMLFMKTILVHLLRKFKLSTNTRFSDIEYEAKIVMFSKKKILIKFEHR